MQAEQLHETTATHDEIRDRLTSELKAVQLKYEDLECTSRDEKETVLAIEKGLREHYDQMNSFLERVGIRIMTCYLSLANVSVIASK
jgi:hypothetical protein